MKLNHLALLMVLASTGGLLDGVPNHQGNAYDGEVKNTTNEEQRRLRQQAKRKAKNKAINEQGDKKT